MMASIKKAIVLVAGRGSRLNPLTETTPKCLVEVGGIPILINTLNHLANAGIREVVLVIGYLGDQIKQEIGSYYKGTQVTYIENREFAETNNMYSLWLAREHLSQGVLLVEGDAFFEDKILPAILDTDEKSYWAADNFQFFGEGCMLTTNDNNEIVDIQIIRDRTVAYSRNQFKSGGLLKINLELGQKLAKDLSVEVELGNTNIYFDLVLAKYLEKHQIFVCNIHGFKWQEIDTAQDLQRAHKLFSTLSLGLFQKNVEIVSIERLRPLELVFPNHLENLNKLLLNDKIVKSPLLADRKTGIVLDGSHRYIFFLMHGYQTVPVHFVNYDNENIRVGTQLLHRHLINELVNISKEEVRKRGLTGNLFPARTTRHFFPFRKIDDLNLPLSHLAKSGHTRDASAFIEDVSKEDEIAHNQAFIQEIEEEIDEIINYLYEARQVKEYLRFQVSQMTGGNPTPPVIADSEGPSKETSNPTTGI
jgi:choline kinase